MFQSGKRNFNFIATLQWIVIHKMMCSVLNSSQHIDWMSNLPTRLQRIPLKYLAIPGSHDSGTYSLHKDDVYIYQDMYSRFLLNSKNASEKEAMGEIIYKWGKTQDLNITEQLKRGIRYLDLRIALDKNGYARVVHGLLGSTFEDVLHQVKNFLKNHDKEVVLLDIVNIHKNDTDADGNEHKIFASLFEVCSELLCPNKLADKSLEFIWKNDCRLFVFYPYSTEKEPDISKRNMTYIFPKNMIKSPFDTQTFTQYSKWLQFLSETYDKQVPHFHVVQGIMQPHWMEVVVAGISETATLKQWVSDRASRELSKWLKGKHNGKHGVNIVIADFIENHDFVDNVIALNTVSSSISIVLNLYFLTCVSILVAIIYYYLS